MGLGFPFLPANFPCFGEEVILLVAIEIPPKSQRALTLSSSKSANFAVFSPETGNRCARDEFADDCVLRQSPLFIMEFFQPCLSRPPDYPLEAHRREGRAADPFPIGRAAFGSCATVHAAVLGGN
jgi:hypothetical protein